MPDFKRGGISEAVSKMMPPDESEPSITNKERQDWNDYVNWLEKKGMKGNAELDKNDLGGKMIDLYRKENPSTSVSRNMIKPIQKEFSKYRDWSLGEVKKGQAALGEGVTPENYMKALSIIDGIAGQRTTSFLFPSKYMTTFVDGKNTGTVNEGFVKSDK